MKTVLDPRDVLVIAVGIDIYADADLRVTGAAAYARRFAEWALGRGVPAANIRLACSPAPAEPPAGIAVLDPTKTVVENLLSEMRRSSAQRLLLYWCGHGVLLDARRRVLYTADAGPDLRRHLNVDDLLHFLGTDAVDHLQHQILVIDACASFRHESYRQDLHLAQQGPIPGDDRDITRFVAFSTDEGQYAQHDNITGRNIFSGTFFDWLESPNGDRLDLDTDALSDELERAFDQLPDSGWQHPIYLRVRSRGRNVDRRHRPSAGDAAEFRPGDIAAAAAALTDWWEAGSAQAERERRAHPDLRGYLIEALGSTESAGAALDTDALMSALFRTGRTDRLYDLLRALSADDERRLWLQRMHIEWGDRRRIATLRRWLPEVTRKMVTDAYWQATPEHTGADHPADLLAALTELAGLRSTPGLPWPLHRFVAALEQLSGARVPDTWFALSPDVLRALRADAAAPRTGTTRIVIDLENAVPEAERFTWPALFSWHQFDPEHRWRRSRHQRLLTRAEVQAEVKALVAPSEKHCLLGFRLPRTAFDEVPELWDFDTEYTEPIPHAHFRPTVLHSADRWYVDSIRETWSNRTLRIRARMEHHPDDILTWILHSTTTDIHHAVTYSDMACVGIGFAVPRYSGRRRGDPLLAAVAAGAAYVVWSTGPGIDDGELRRQVGELLRNGAFEDFPARLREHRRNGAIEASAGIRLLWDDPAALPDPPRYLGM